MATTKWAIDTAHSEIGFKVRHMMISNVRGTFERFETEVETEGDDFTTASISFAADIDSINTRNEQRDGHLKSADFFDAANFPQLTFKGSKLEAVDGGHKLHGELSIRGTSKQIALDVDFGGIATDPWGAVRAGFELSGEISRKEFGLQWDAVTEAGSIVVADQIHLQVHVELVKQ